MKTNADSEIKRTTSSFFRMLILSFVLGVLFFSAILRDIKSPAGTFSSWQNAFLSTFRVSDQFYWLGVLLAYTAFFAVINLLTYWPSRLRSLEFWNPKPRDAIWISTLLLSCMTAMIAARYFLNYGNAADSTDTLVLLIGILIQQGLLRLLPSERIQAAIGQRRFLIDAYVLIGCLCLLLTPLNPRQGFFYHGQPRWSGIYSNPNEFGMIMAVIIVLAAGRVWKYARSARLGRASVYVLPMIFSGVCVIKSYSREAWVSVSAGLLFLAWSKMRHKLKEAGNFTASANSGSRWERKAMLWGGAGLLMGICLTGAIKTVSQSRLALVQRAFSAFSQVDFSSRNRLASYQDGIDMLLDKPLAGFGWQDLVAIHDHLYLQPGLSDGTALKLNDFLMFALRFGIPTLAVFILFIRFWFLAPARALPKRWNDDMALSQAAVLMLAIGFVFSDGLCRLAPGASFWLFLTLAMDFEAIIPSPRQAIIVPAELFSTTPSK
jgi:hypothetical protein